ncbi:MAG: hypothetical protein L0241_03045 [Planctomycetia bacterium]|nr:hypothetical protein [Planctomycetia bacterium]
MANQNTPPAQPSSSLSAAELRRRLLASTPPPLASAAPNGEEDLDVTVPLAVPIAAVTATPTPVPAPASSPDLLARLRMPGKSGPLPVPPARPAAPAAPPTQRAPVNRQTPPPHPSNNRAYSDPASAIAGALSQLAELQQNGRQYDDSPHAENQRLKGEIKELRSLLEEMKQLLQEASETEQQLVTKEKEFEKILAEKDSQIDDLSTHLGAIEEQIAKGELVPPPPVPKTRTELEDWADELEKESAKLTQDKKKLEDERRQLREDEEALEKQMRDMEVAMARERAMIARQETELKRLSAEIQHELEILQRGDAGLREQMQKFQRRAAEVMTKPGAGNPPGRR